MSRDFYGRVKAFSLPEILKLKGKLSVKKRKQLKQNKNKTLQFFTQLNTFLPTYNLLLHTSFCLKKANS